MLRPFSRLLLPVAVLLAAVGVPTTAAVAQDGCPAPGGVDGDPPISAIQYDDVAPEYDREVSKARTEDPYAEDVHDVVFSGGGWGHGIGLSQFAAQGAASLGCTYPEILEAHFPGTALEQRPSRPGLRLKVATTSASGVTSLWAEGDVTWSQCQQNSDGTTREDTCSTFATQPAGSRVTVSLTADAWRLQGGIDQTLGSRTHTVLRAGHNGTLVRVDQGAEASVSVGLPIRHGVFELDYTGLNGGRLFATQIIDESNRASGLSPMDTYLLGLAEVPFAWKPDALRTQVVAARSYAESVVRNRSTWSEGDRIGTLDCRCDLRVDTGDQVWAGATKEIAEPTYYPSWVDAVKATAGEYVVRDGKVLTTFYSSSFGGHSRKGFSHADPNYSAVDVSRWEKASGNSRYRWSQGFSRADLQRAFGIDDIDGIRVVSTDDAGYPTAVEVTGVDGGKPVTVTYKDPYQQIRSRLGLYSSRFVIHTITDLADDTAIPIQRLDGDTRSDTAIRLSQSGWSDGASTVILAREDNPADALTGSSLAGTHDAPLLLTAADGLDDDVAVELQRLDPDQVLLLGGPVALSRQVADDVRTTLGITDVRRVAGDTRHGTAVEVARQSSRGDQTTAYLVRLRDTQVEARGWVDALSVAAVAARRAADETAWPILGTEATLPDETRQAIAELGVTRIVPVGGPVTIPQEVLDELQSMGVEVAPRLAGEDRYGTSRAVTASDTPTAESLVIATGENFPDGLAAGPFAARTGAALLLVPTVLNPDVSPWQPDEHPAFVDGLGWAEPQLVAVGGPVAIENPVIDRVANLLEAEVD